MARNAKNKDKGVSLAKGPVAIIGLLAFLTLTTPDVHVKQQQSLRAVVSVMRRPRIVEGVGLLFVPGVCFGVLGVVAPLRINALGGGAGIIAGVYTVIAIIEGPSLNTVVIALVVSALGAGLCVAPGFAFLSDGALALSIHQAFAVGLANMAWSGGQAIGGFGGGALASGGHPLPLIAVFILLVVALMWAMCPVGERVGKSISCREQGC